MNGRFGNLVGLIILLTPNNVRRYDVYETVEKPLKVFQTMALFEVVHAALGIVRSSPFTTFLQGLYQIAFFLYFNCVCDSDI